MRYLRQTILKEIGQRGQQKLRESKVLIVGAGGLGSAASFYLAASGVGIIGVVDPDQVELSNLQRQILHCEDHIGMPKVISAMITLKRLNSEIKILPYPEPINQESVSYFFTHFDLVVACPDNFRVRKILNEASFRFRKPLVVGAVSGFEGQVLTVNPPKSPCYQCLFEDAYDEEEESGILSPVAGVIGSIQAVEAIKILLGVGSTLEGRILIYDGLKAKFREVSFTKRHSCKVCAAC